jgi:hypothetical protein
LRYQISRHERTSLQPLRSGDRFRANAALILDRDRNPFQIVSKLRGGNAQNVEIQCPQFGIANSIGFHSVGRVMRRAVHFDDQVGLAAIEIDDIPTNGMLTAELEAILAPAQN